MAWSETMFIIQHFYNVFDIDRRLTDVEGKSPLVARSINGLPEDTEVGDLTPGTLWFIRDASVPSAITSISILKEDNTFADPIPFSVDLNNLPIDSDIQQIISSMDLTASNYYDIIKLILGILKTVPVKYGGTGLQSIAKDVVLVGDANNTFKQIGFDNTPTQRSENLINSGALYTQFEGKANKNHASETQDFGFGTNEKYGHLKITDDYEELGSDPTHTAVSVSAINALLENIQNFLIKFKVIDEETLYSSNITAYQPSGADERILRLIDDYFSVELNTTGNYTLVIK